MKPQRSILDPAFAYTPASHTDIRKRFQQERERIEQARLIAARDAAFAKVTALKKK